jgi:hypothetical protein
MTDWAGFNIPSWVLGQLICFGKIEDINKYDKVMSDVYRECVKKAGGDKFYLIGAMGEDERTIRHELAHGFFYCVPEYKAKMEKLVEGLDLKFRNGMYKEFKRLGYTKEVYVDECQAYLSTGMGKNFPEVNGENELFIEVYNKYYV